MYYVLYIIYYTLYIIHYVLYIIYYILYIIYYILYIIYYILCIIYYILYINEIWISINILYEMTWHWELKSFLGVSEPLLQMRSTPSHAANLGQEGLSEAGCFMFFSGKRWRVSRKKMTKSRIKKGHRIWWNMNACDREKFIQNVNKMWRMELFNTPLGFSSGNKTRQQKISRFDRSQAWLTGDYLPSVQICGLKKNIQAIGKCPFDLPQAMTWSTTEHHQLFISKRSVNGQFLHSYMWEFLKIGIPKSPLVSILSHGHPRLGW